jgi:tetratricopeptide (TPR) repeat protein
MDMSTEQFEALMASANRNLTPEGALELSAKLYDLGLATAIDLYRRNRIADAAEIYGFLVELQPGRMEALVGLGQCLIDLEDPINALRIMVSVSSVDPENANAWLISGKAQLMLGVHEAAIDDFETAEECARDAGRRDMLDEIARFKAAAVLKVAESGGADA